MNLKQTKVIDSVSPLAKLPEPIPEVEMNEKDLTLGEPMGIREAARIIGCSPWSVRQSLLPQGLPHWRSGTSGKLIFYRDQVVRWLIAQQEGRRK
jgi:hypothetical protein